MPRFLICLFVLLFYFIYNTAVVYAAEANAPETTSSPSTTDISAGTDVGAGLPTVTGEEFTDKITRIVGAIYKDVLKIAPQITILVCAFGGILGIFLREARYTVLWAIGGLIFILWLPQLLGLVIHYLNM